MSEKLPLIDAAQLAHLRTWVGKSQSTPDLITPAPVRSLSATFDRDDSAPVTGTELPPLWHWLYFLPHAKQSEIGPDGHPTRGGFLPPVALPRRMWAGGRLIWETGNPLAVGQEVERVSTIKSVNHKAGRSGELLFVVVEHRYSNANGLALTEEHDIVFREAAEPGAPEPTPQKPSLAGEEAWSRTIVPDDVLLFRYSALTFNGHRIHYDQSYARDEEGYPDLVVHGPLTATLLQQLALEQGGGRQLAQFDFRGVSPLFVTRGFRLEGKRAADGSLSLWARGPDGELAMSATATFR